MEIEVTREALVRELGLARRLGERKATIPVYSYAKLDTEFGEVRISATDGDAGLETSCGCTVSEAGSTLVPVRTLHEMARAASSELVQLSTDGLRVNIKAGGFKSKLSTIPVVEFPSLEPSPETLTQINAANLRAAFEKSRFVVEAAASAGGNYYTHGALLKVGPVKLTVVATDGRRLTHVQANHQNDTESQVILPRKGMDDLSALLAIDTSETVGYARDSQRAFFHVGVRRFITRLIDAEFPTYHRVIPKAGKNSVDVDRDLWAGALRRVMLVSRQNSSKVTLSVLTDSIELSMETKDVGETSESVKAELTGEPWESCFDSKFMADFLEASDSGTIRMAQASPRDGAALTSIDGDVEYLYVLMPMS